jgi:hypothetical protein
VVLSGQQLTSLAEAEKALVWRAPVKALRAANMMAGSIGGCGLREMQVGGSSGNQMKW